LCRRSNITSRFFYNIEVRIIPENLGNLVQASSSKRIFVGADVSDVVKPAQSMFITSKRAECVRPDDGRDSHIPSAERKPAQDS
jgi:hypothetical protein